MTKRSSGTVLYRIDGSDVRVLLVHPSGGYNRRAPWSIPKGEPDDGETDEAAARRETLEETGIAAADLSSLGTITYTKSKKTVAAFAGPAPSGVEPRCASWEVDRAEFLSLEDALERIHPEQRPFLDRLARLLLEQAAR